MKKTRIEWADMTWNPVTGCYHNCPYCYARSIANRFGGFDIDSKSSYFAYGGKVLVLDSPLYIIGNNCKRRVAPFPNYFTPTFHKYRLDEPLHVRKPQTVFVGSMCDLFGEWVPDEWIYAVFDACAAAPQHRYLFLTKNPGRYLRLNLPDEKNFWFGVTATKHEEAEFAFRYLPPTWKYNLFLSAEPLLGGMNFSALAEYPKWIITGAMTGAGAKRNQPRREWADGIVKFADKTGIPVFMKDSLIPIVGAESMRMDFPWTNR